MRRNDPFTLIELVVVMVIIAMATGLAVSTFRGESPARKLQSAGLEFETFCAGVRYQAQETGEDRIVFLDTENKQLLVKAPAPAGSENSEEEGKNEDEEDDGEEEKILRRWSFPEDFSLDLEDESDDGEEHLELFRFFPDGGASGMRELTFSVKELKRRYRISPLTGQLFLLEEEEEE